MAHAELQAEQVAYYRAHAPEYLDGLLDVPGGSELRRCWRYPELVLLLGRRLTGVIPMAAW